MSESNAKELEGEDLECIEAEFVNIKQSSIRAVEGGHVELQQVGALSIDGERVEMTQSASAITHGDDVDINQSMSVIAVGNTISLNYSFSPLSLTRDSAAVNRSAVGIIGAREVHAEHTSAIMLIAKKVEGEVTTILDWRSALALGAVVGGALGFLSLFRKR
ncbi:MAG TPA: hypothetical protein VEI46_00505 [Thermodesulfovibrionales bacterium]|nr:hypothetical protein [Thermodesulfovibrionales bacterium]